VTDPDPAIDVTSPRTPTAELHRLRRGAVVEAAWFLGFVIGFGLAGMLGVGILWEGLLLADPATAMLRYVAKLFVWGLGGGLVGAIVGQVVAAVWKRIDLRRNPRRYEPTENRRR
jgi:hypothetical protein